MLKKIVSTLISCAIAAMIIEGFFVLLYYLKDQRFEPAESMIRDMAPDKSWRLVDENCDMLTVEVPHPYLAFSTLAKPNCPGYQRDSGHTGKVFPRRRDPDKFVVLFTGASVPVQLLEDASPTFGEMLSQQYSFQGKKIVVLNGSVYRWKQPQQYIMLMLNTHLIDAVVSMEGFNELVNAFANEYTHDFSAPMLQTLQRSNLNFLSPELLILSWLYKESYQIVRDSSILNHSKTAAFLLRVNRNWLNKFAEKDDSRLGAFRQQTNPFRLPMNWSYDEKKLHYLSMYKHYIRNMQVLAQSNNIKFALFIQPIPKHGKTLTLEEKTNLKNLEARAVNKNRMAYGENYAEMRDSLMELRNEGINIFSLADVFADFKDTAYKDGIHLDIESRAPQVLSQAIIDVLAVEWGLEKKPEGTRTISDMKNSH